jgi:peptide/nickel transport system substrate-binding protein
VKLNFPAASFLVNNTVYGIVPEHVLKDVAPAALARHDFSTGKKGVTIGTGPFMFGEWVQNDHVTLEKYKGYWEVEPSLDRYVYKIVTNQTVLAQQIKTGEIDYTGPDGVDEADYQDLQRTKDVNVIAYDSFDFTFYAYQLDPEKSKLFLDKRVRQALFLAVNRPQMIEAIRFGLGEVAIGTMGVDSWAYNPSAIALKYNFDQATAKKLLDEAGWLPGADGIRAKDGQRLAFKVYTNAGNKVREQYAAVLQQAWKQIGVDATPQVEEWTTLLDRITGPKDFDMYLIGLSWDPDPDQSSMWSTDAYQAGFNMNKYSNPTVDELLKQGLLETDIGKRKQIYTDMQNVVVDDLPSAIIDFPKSIAAVNTRVHNLFPNAIDDRFNAHQWWVDA